MSLLLIVLIPCALYVRGAHASIPSLLILTRLVMGSFWLYVTSAQLCGVPHLDIVATVLPCSLIALVSMMTLSRLGVLTLLALAILLGVSSCLRSPSGEI